MKEIKLLESIIKTWEEMTKTKLEESTSWALSRYNEILKKSLNSSQNVWLLIFTMETMLHNYLADKRINGADLIFNRDPEVERMIDGSRKIKELLSDSEYQSVKSGIYSKINAFFERIGYNSDKVEELLTKDEKMYKVLEHYFENLDVMEIHQFKKGRISDEKPMFVSNVEVFDSISTALQYAEKVKVNFVALSAVKPDDSEHGFFAYVIKNGENIYIHTDLKRSKNYYHNFSGSHDTYKEIMPYVQLREWEYVWSYYDFYRDEEVDINTDKYYIVPKNRDWNQLLIREWEPDEIMYQFFMFNHLKDVYFDQKAPTKELSYSSDSIVVKHKSINLNKLPALPGEKVEVEYPSIKKKKEQVISKINKEDTFLIPHIEDIDDKRIDLVPMKLKDKLLTMNGEIVMDDTEIVFRGLRKSKQGISNKFFGTKEDIDKIVNETAEVNILNEAIKNYLSHFQDVVVPKLNKFFDHMYKTKQKTILERMILSAFPEFYKGEKVASFTAYNTEMDYRLLSRIGRLEKPRKGYKPCQLDGKSKTYSYIINTRIKTTEDFLYLFDITEDELPKELLNLKIDEYRGNSFFMNPFDVNYSPLSRGYYYSENYFKDNRNPNFTRTVNFRFLDPNGFDKRVSLRGLKNFLKEHGKTIEDII